MRRALGAFALGVLAAAPASARTSALTCTQADSQFGTAAAAAGDVDADGIGDLLVGAPSFDAIEFGEGAAFVFLGAEGGIPDGDENDATGLLESNRTQAHLGDRVASAGDVDGDGYDDVILTIGNYRYVPQIEPGYVLIFRGGPGGIGNGNVQSADTELWNDLSGWIGRSVHGLGDVNGDGYDDVESSGPRGVFVWHGGPGGIPDGGAGSAVASVLVNQPGSFTFTVAGGDVNGDGYDDVAVGVPYYDAGAGTDDGSVFLYLGGPSGIGGGSLALADAQLQAGYAGAAFGAFVAIGDLDGDAFGDLVVTASQGGSDAAFVYRGSASGIPSGTIATADATVTGVYRASALLDFDGDGYGDVVLSDPAYVHRLLLGGPGGPPSGSLETVAAPIAELPAVSTVAAAGDLDDDGADDLVQSTRNGSTWGVRIVYGPEASDSAAVAAACALGVALARNRARRLG